MKKFSKRLLTFVLACAMVFGLSGMTAFAAEEEDPGISTLDSGDEYEPSYDWYVGQTSPYEISTASDLVGLSNIVNGTAPENVGKDSFKDKTINVNAINGVIDMNETAVEWGAEDVDGVVNIEKTVDGAQVFTPIGTLSDPFEGTFDGNGVKIKNLYVTSDDGCLGLFGAVGSTDATTKGACGTVENFSLDGIVECTGGDSDNQKDFVGGAVGRLYAGGTVEYVTNEHLLVDAPGADNVGGIVGFAGTPTGEGYDNNPSVSNTSVSCCENKATIRAYYKVGGIVGENAATVKYCCNSGWIMCRRNSGSGAGVGGIVGRNGNNNDADEEALVAYCYNTGPITNGGRNDDSASNTIRGFAGISGTTFGNAGTMATHVTHNCYNIGAIPVGNRDYGSITTNIEYAGYVSVYDNYSLDDKDLIHNYDSSVQTNGTPVSESDFKVTSRGDDDILTKLGVYFEPDYTGTDAINDHYPILFWQANKKEPKMTDFRIETSPTKTTYNDEVFDPTGMVVIASYDNGLEMEIPCAYASYNGTTYTLPDCYTYDTEEEIASDATQFPITFDGWTLNVPVNNGEEDTPPLNDKGQYVLDSVADLEWFADQVNNKTYDGHLALDAIVAADIDASESESFSPIGGSTNVNTAFQGTFDGDGHTITLNISGTNYQGLFSMVNGDDASVSNVTVAGSVNGTGNMVGGVVGYLYKGSITDCVNEASVTAAMYAGGITGYAYSASITNCSNKGSVTSSGNYAGGIVPYAPATVSIDGCLNSGSVSGGGAYVAGIVGYASNNAITNCGNDGSVTSTANDVGGIVGRAVVSGGITISSCYNKGNIEGTYDVAGIIGYHSYQTTIDSCYNMGVITSSAGTNAQASGGIVGVSNGATLTNIFNTGDIKATYGGALLGGGTTTSSSITIKNGYYLENSAAEAVSSEANGTITMDEVSSKTADEIKSEDFLKLLTDAGGDFKAGCGHPILTWETAEHTWGDVTWAWSADNTEATASRECTACGMVETVDAQVATDSTAAGERTVGKTTYTATATFEDGTTVTDEKDVFTPATGSIAIEINKGGDEPETSELAYSAINDAMDNTAPQKFTYTSGGGTNEVYKPFVTISSLLNIEDTINDVCCYHVIADMPDNYYEIDLPTTTCLYYRDDTLIYRTAVNGSAGRMWVDNPTTIEVNYVHDWGDLTWDWSDDYSEATVTGSCQRSVCKKYGVEETATATVTSTTTATATKDGETTYTATATFSDGTEVTDTVTVDQQAFDPDGYITVVVNGESMEIANTTIDAAIEAANTITIANSRGSEVTAKFVKLSDLIGISEEDFESFTVTDSDDEVTADLPTDTYLYWRDDRACYRIAVDDGAPNMWRNDPTTIEVVGFEEVDKSSLNALIEEAKGLDEAEYTAESWEALQTALADAEDVSASIVATQDDVDKAQESLQAAIDDLTTAKTADKDALEAAIEEAKDLVETDYSDGWDAFEEALTAAEAVDDDADALQSAVDAAAKDLQDAMDALTAKTADKEALEAAIDEAKDLVETDYSDGWDALEDALAAAEAMDADADALQSAVDAAAKDLQDAMDALTAKTADKDALEDEIATAEDKMDGMNKDDYTEDSWNALEDALEAAKEVAAESDPLQSAVDAAAKDLQDALDGLTEKPADSGNVKNGLCCIEKGVRWGYYVDDVVDTSFTGFVNNENGDWYVENGYVVFADPAECGVFKDKAGAIGTKGTWYYVVRGKVQYGFTGLAHYKNENGWWYIKKGVVDFTHNGVDKNQNGWWYVVRGKVRFNYTGLSHYRNANGWWYIKKGKVDFTHNGVDKNQNGWWYVVRGKVRFNYTGLAHYRNANGWWYVKGGKVTFDYTGIASNQNGTWYVRNSKVQFDYTGTVTSGGRTYTVQNGKVR